MRLHEAAPKLIIQERLGDKVKVSSYWPVPELTRVELALGRLHVLCTTLPVYCACVAHFFSAEYNLFCIWLQDMLTTHMTISAAQYALLCTKRSNSSTGIYLKAIYGIISVIFTI